MNKESKVLKFLNKITDEEISEWYFNAAIIWVLLFAGLVLWHSWQ